MSRRQTKKEFEQKHPGKKWTRNALRHFSVGKKTCSKCKQVLPVFHFGFYLTHPSGSTISVRSWCRACHRRASSKWKARDRRKSNREILEDDLCDHCGESGADWYWRNTESGDSWDWVGLHKHCIGPARENGVIPERALPRKKVSLHQKKTNHIAEMEQLNKKILQEEVCACCGEKGAHWYWRNVSGGDYSNWVVLHKRCFGVAREAGLIPEKSRPRPKSRLELVK